MSVMKKLKEVICDEDFLSTGVEQRILPVNGKTSRKE